MLGNGFTKKKVGSLTLGEKLRKVRADYRISIIEVSRSTGIRKEYLEALEGGDYGRLPADVYVRGFLRSYAQFLGADPASFIRLYERERSIARNLGRSDVPSEKSNVPTSGLRRLPVVITPRLAIAVVATLLFVAIAVYLYREFRAFVSEPYLIVEEPVQGIIVSSDRIIVAGRTDRDARLSLNGQSATVGEEGRFREEVRLRPGINTIAIRVTNRFDREREETLSLEAEYIVPESTPPTPIISPEEIPNGESSTGTGTEQQIEQEKIPSEEGNLTESSEKRTVEKEP